MFYKTYLFFVLQTQRRVTFHLPDGSQESCSDSGLGDPEPSSTASATQALPMSFPQEDYYEQTSPNSRTEGDGNSDPESSESSNFLPFEHINEKMKMNIKDYFFMVHAYDFSQKYPHKFLTRIFCQLNCTVKVLGKIKQGKKVGQKINK